MGFDNKKKVSIPVVLLLVITVVTTPLFAPWFHFHPGEDHPDINGENFHSHLSAHKNHSHEHKTVDHHNSDRGNYFSSGLHFIKNIGSILDDGIIFKDDLSPTICFVNLSASIFCTNKTHVSSNTRYYLKLPPYFPQDFFVLFVTNLSPPTA